MMEVARNGLYNVGKLLLDSLNLQGSHLRNWKFFLCNENRFKETFCIRYLLLGVVTFLCPCVFETFKIPMLLNI